MTSPFDPAHITQQIAEWKKEGKSIVFTNGVFDILHLGHATYLEKAKALGDVLIVGVNSDASVRRLGKGPERPIHTAEDRARLLNALRSVDSTLIFEEDTPLQCIQMIQPNVLVKGGDYNPDCTDEQDSRYMVGSDIVRASGGHVVAIDLVPGHSTTGIIRRSTSQ
jgi:D-beta-D-heptose 7-phosphate kinase/D-beta-D-heptose 1-phosphate adenosyltransferase